MTLGYQADPRSRTFPIEIEVDNKGEALLPDMVARIKIPSGPAKRRVLIPLSAVATEGDAAYVYRIQANRVTRQVVVLGAPSGDKVEIVSGLASGDRIADSPQRPVIGTSASFNVR